MLDVAEASARTSVPMVSGTTGIELERALIAEIDEARATVAQELHDTVCQSLGCVRLSAAAIRRRIRSDCPSSAGDMEKLDALWAASIDELHDTVQSLQAVTVEPAELISSLEALAVVNRKAVFRSTATGSVADAFIAGQIYRIARELLMHAKRRSCAPTIDWAGGGSRFSLRITTSAPCFSTEYKEEARPIERALLERRARAIGGELVISASEVTLTLPG